MTISGYAENVRPTGAISFGRVALNAGANTIEITGKDAKSIGYYMGLTALC